MNKKDQRYANATQGILNAILCYFLWIPVSLILFLCIFSFWVALTKWLIFGILAPMALIALITFIIACILAAADRKDDTND